MGLPSCGKRSQALRRRLGLLPLAEILDDFFLSTKVVGLWGMQTRHPFAVIHPYGIKFSDARNIRNAVVLVPIVALMSACESNLLFLFISISACATNLFIFIYDWFFSILM